jgi:hypothetical protein
MPEKRRELRSDEPITRSFRVRSRSRSIVVVGSDVLVVQMFRSKLTCKEMSSGLLVCLAQRIIDDIQTIQTFRHSEIGVEDRSPVA